MSFHGLDFNTYRSTSDEWWYREALLAVVNSMKLEAILHVTLSLEKVTSISRCGNVPNPAMGTVSLIEKSACMYVSVMHGAD